MNDQSDIPTDVPAIGISFKHTLDDFREVVFQGYVPVSCSDAMLNDLLDKLSKASDRQKAKTHLPTIKSLLEIKKEAFKTENQNLFLAVSERDTMADFWKRESQATGRRNWKPSPSQSQEHAKVQGRIAQGEQNLRVLAKEIDAYERQLADMETKLGVEG